MSASKLELIVSTESNELKIALLENNKLVEYRTEDRNNCFSVGDCFLGKIVKVSQNLNASFVDVGYKKYGFLSYTSLSKYSNDYLDYFKDIKDNNNVKLSKYELNEVLDKDGNISDILKENQNILVQIAKEPISSKGPRLSTAITLSGKYFVLLPFSNEVHVSKNITNNNERDRLTNFVNSLRPNNFGVIIRTAAEGIDNNTLSEDMTQLLKKWSTALAKVKNANVGDKIISEDNKIITIIRNMLSTPLDVIYIDDEALYIQVKNFIVTEHICDEKILKLYSNKSVPLFNYKDIKKQIQLSMNKYVNIDGGGYLIIEQTEAMLVIDVNSGMQNDFSDHEEMAYHVNIIAAQEIARQLRLRDIGGIISIDFIDMETVEHKMSIYELMKEYMKNDKNQHLVLPLSRFNVMQITRQRLKTLENVDIYEVCPMCRGNGRIEPVIQIADKIEKQLLDMLQNKDIKGFTVIVHPFLYSYFTKGLISKRIKWWIKYKKWVKFKQDFSLEMIDYKIV